MLTGRPGLPEILLVVLLLVIFFGARRLPELARSLGKSINEFKRGRQEGALPEDGGEAQNGEDK